MAFDPKNIELEKAARRRAKAKRHAALDYQLPKHFKIFRNSLLASIIVVMLAVIYTIYWFVIATNLKEGVADWVAARAAEGITARYKQIEISGFPLKFTVVLTRPELQAAEPGGETWQWQGGRAVAEMKPWNFKQFRVDLSGAHELTYQVNRRRRHYLGTVQHFILAGKIYTAGWPENFQLDIAGLSLVETGSKTRLSAATISVTSQRLSKGRADDNGNVKLSAKTPTLALDVQLKDLRLPTFLNFPLGYDIQELKTELKVIAPLQPSLKVENLAAWRDAGGVIEIALLEAIYGTVKIHATGTLALDKNLQPLAAMTAKLQGFFPAINKLKKAGYIRSGDAAMAKVVLGVLSRRNAKGQRSISLPLTLQDGQLSAGPAALMAIPAIDWGEDPPPPQ